MKITIKMMPKNSVNNSENNASGGLVISLHLGFCLDFFFGIAFQANCDGTKNDTKIKRPMRPQTMEAVAVPLVVVGACLAS